MKEKILAMLRAKYKNVHSDLLDRVAVTMAKTVTKEEDIQAAIDAQDGFITEMADYSQKEADRRVTEALKKKTDDSEAAKKKAEEDAAAEAAKQHQGKDVPEWAKALIDSNKALSDKLAAIEAGKSHEALSSKLISQLKEKGVDETFYTPAIAGRQFKDEAEINALTETLHEAHVKHIQALTDKGLGGGKPLTPNPGNTDKVNPIVAQMVAEKLGDAKVGSLEGKPLKI